MSNIPGRTLGITRREFTVESALALLAGVTITVTGCGGGGDDSTPTSPTPPPASGDVSGSISGNHGHVATITAARLGAGGALSLDISGSAGHPHTVDLSADEVARVAQRQRIAKTSTTTDAHNHTVTFN